MRPYSQDLRTRVLADYDAGMGNAAVARKYSVSDRWVYNLRKLREETGDIKPRKGKFGPKPKLAKHGERLLELVEQHPDATLEELRELLGVKVSITALWNKLKSLGVSFKKSGSCR